MPKMKLTTLKELADELSCNDITIRVYLSREEFSHIQKVRKGKYILLANVLKKDIIRLQKLVNRKKANSWHQGEKNNDC